VNWGEMQARQPRLADLGEKRLIEPGVVLVATIRRDGTPRLSPVEPWVMDGVLWLCMMWQSTKARDLMRDSRILVHSVITNREGAEGELKVRGTARLETSPDVQRRYSDAVTAALGWTPSPGRSHLFAVDIEDVTYMSYDTATGDQHVAMWPPGREFIRRGDSGTSVGDPEPAHDIIQAS
jgi:pyridoxamine 5'-phosphate oxidase-like protein